MDIKITVYNGRKAKNLDPKDPKTIHKFWDLIMSPKWTRIVYSRPKPMKLPKLPKLPKFLPYERKIKGIKVRP